MDVGENTYIDSRLRVVQRKWFRTGSPSRVTRLYDLAGYRVYESLVSESFELINVSFAGDDPLKF